MTSIQTLENYGFRPEFKLFSFKEGIYILEMKLTGKSESGEPLLIVDPSCQLLIEGFRGGYRWDAKGDRAKDSIYCHLFDALRYVMTMEFTASSVSTRPTLSTPEAQAGDSEWNIIKRMFGMAEQEAEKRKQLEGRREIWE